MYQSFLEEYNMNNIYTRFCSKAESIPDSALEHGMLWGKDGYYNPVTSLPYLYWFNVNSNDNNNIDEFLVETKCFNNSEIKTDSNSKTNTIIIDIDKVCDYSSLEEMAEMFSDEWCCCSLYPHIIPNESQLESYVKRFHEKEYIEYCNMINNINEQEQFLKDKELHEYYKKEYEQNSKDERLLKRRQMKKKHSAYFYYSSDSSS